jgi:hypothetical protein
MKAVSVNTRFLNAVVLCLLFVLPSEAQFIHPGMLHTKAELEFIKDKIKVGEEPWFSEFRLLQADPHAKTDWKTRPLADVIQGSYNNPDIGAKDLGNDAQAAYLHAIEWALTGNPAHAKKAVEILNERSYSLKSISGANEQLLAGITGNKFCNAAEIIKHTSNIWKQADQEQLKKMLLTVFYPLLKNYKPQNNGNWDASMITTIMCIAIFIDDPNMYKNAVEYARNGKSLGAIPNYIYESGQCQESGRDQGHTQMGLGFVGDYCEIAWKQGDDLYSAFNNRLAAGFEYTSKYNLGDDVLYDSVPDIFGRHLNPKISEQGRGRFRPVYEKVYHHYHDRMGLEMKYTRMVIDKIQPEGFNWDHSSFGTLMYSGLPVFLKRNDSK